MDIYTILLISLKNNLNLNDGNFLIKLILNNSKLYKKKINYLFKITDLI